MANPPSTKNKANPSARATGKSNSSNGHGASNASRAKRTTTNKNADGVPAKRQNTGVNGHRPRETQVLRTTNNDGTSGAAEAILDGDEILQKYNEIKGYLYMQARQESYLPYTIQQNMKKKRPQEPLLKSSWRVLEYKEELKA
jgi:hypothetical protein